MQHQMEVVSPIYMAADMTAFTKMTILNIPFTQPNVTVLIECFHLQNEKLVHEVQDMSQKND